jgi:hypothetical protein
MKNENRRILLKSAWKASSDERFSEAALIESAVNLADEGLRPTLRGILPSVWKHLDREADVARWISATGLDGESIDAVQATIGAGLPASGKKAGLHDYALRPKDFTALLFYAFIAARLATPYKTDDPHRKVRDQFWYAPELVVIVMRCLPPKLDLAAVERILRIILGPPIQEFRMLSTAGVAKPFFPPFTIGEPDLNDYFTGETMGKIEIPGEEDEDE